jgi:hypothetical protein
MVLYVKVEEDSKKLVTVPIALKLKPNIALVEQKLLTLQENLNLSPVFSGFMLHIGCQSLLLKS